MKLKKKKFFLKLLNGRLYKVRFIFSQIGWLQVVEKDGRSKVTYIIGFQKWISLIIKLLFIYNKILFVYIESC